MTAKLDALGGFDRALADARAIRDQAIVAARSNQIDIRVANKNYEQFYKTILHAYNTALTNAKATLLSSMATAKAKK